jgi:hypothetical protein
VNDRNHAAKVVEGAIWYREPPGTPYQVRSRLWGAGVAAGPVLSVEQVSGHEEEVGCQHGASDVGLEGFEAAPGARSSSKARLSKEMLPSIQARNRFSRRYTQLLLTI